MLITSHQDRTRGACCACHTLALLPLTPPRHPPANPEIRRHEMTHGFDDTGHLLDKNGDEKDWWDPKTFAEFDDRAGCLASQYDDYGNEVPKWYQVRPQMDLRPVCHRFARSSTRHPALVCVCACPARLSFSCLAPAVACRRRTPQPLRPSGRLHHRAPVSYTHLTLPTILLV